MPYLEIKNLHKSYGKKEILKNISFDVSEGELFTILGPSGSGKTTIINCISGVTDPNSGEILLDNLLLDNLPTNERNIGLVFQEYSLFDNLTVRDNIDFALQAKIRKTLPDILKWKLLKKERYRFQNEIEIILKKVDLKDHFNKYPKQLSGGEKQRVALARALIQEPKLLCLDEPLAALDKNLKKELQKEIKRIQRETGKTFIYITHDQTEAFTISDRIAVINNGEIIQVDTPKNIYEFPKTKFIANFIGDNNLFKIEKIENQDNKLVFVTDKGAKFVFQETNKEEIPQLPFTICLRPEKLTFKEKRLYNNLKVKLNDIIYLDGRIKIVGGLTTGEEITTMCNSEHNFSKGDTINLYYSEKDILILNQ
ncbi:ABC transporter ATP-binding protein [uncultured Draconibacterium sp.]|uniref:ABC transporter ATP-binding protein n=1 Tax=uncultured Draconibacterium sp. TaxID=1573823 RepID=UPI002AA83557|nr:ABC transporter ATP-binding protein [uncultured Draconibacterium sp.]